MAKAPEKEMVKLSEKLRVHVSEKLRVNVSEKLQVKPSGKIRVNASENPRVKTSEKRLAKSPLRQRREYPSKNRKKRKKFVHPYGSARVFYRSYLRKYTFVKNKRRPKRIRRLKRRLLRTRFVKKVRFGKLFIRLRRLNIFLAVTLKRRKQNRIKLKTSTGCSKYRGKKKASPLAQKITVRNFAKRLVARNIRIIDVYFCRKVGRTYKVL